MTDYVFETLKEMLVQINGLQSEVMEYLLTFLYTARTTITPSNVQMLLEAANLFQIDLLKRKCTDFMYKQLDPCNCLGMKVSLYDLNAYFGYNGHFVYIGHL